MRKLAILTHPLAENYGGNLQAASLYHYLHSCGYQVTLLRKHFKTKELSPATKFGRFFLERTPFQNRKGYRKRAKLRKLTDRFIRKFIPGATKIVYTREEVANIVQREDFDAVIVGSDQVWRMKYIDDGQYTAYFLDFPKNAGMKKIAYAASFGTDEWEAPDRIAPVRDLLSDFDAISVREASGIDICHKVFGLGDCRLALDPTLLVESGFFTEMLGPPRIRKKRTLLTYILDPSPANTVIVDVLMKTLGPSYLLNPMIGGKHVYSIKEWLSAFRSADYVVTDSFHGMIFSIIFKKHFVVIGNPSRGMARFTSLLDQLSLRSRLVESGDKIDVTLNSAIDYDRIDACISKLRESSKLFLTEALSQDKQITSHRSSQNSDA